MTEKIFLVRHGRYNRDGLTPEGREDARHARDELLTKGLGGRAIVLSSSADRAMRTAEIIAEGLGALTAESFRMDIGGNRPEAIQNLDDWISRALKEAEASVGDEQQLVVVTHAPLIDVAKGLTIDGVGHGEVYEYLTGSWNNPGYQDFEATLVDYEISNGKV